MSASGELFFLSVADRYCPLLSVTITITTRSIGGFVVNQRDEFGRDTDRSFCSEPGVWVRVCACVYVCVRVCVVYVSCVCRVRVRVSVCVPVKY